MQPDEHTGEDRSNTGTEQGAVGGAPPPQQANMGLPGQHMLLAPGLQLFLSYQTFLAADRDSHMWNT